MTNNVSTRPLSPNVRENDSQMKKDYQHQHAAHCETGAISALLRHHGLPISEAMAFGLGAGITFIHMPWVKVGGLPLTAYRMWPGAIIATLAKQLGIGMVRHRYRDPAEAMADLDRHLDAGHVVGLQTSVFWLPYFPAEMRFHFNAHNLLVYGKDGDDYLISDPVFEHPVRCPAEALQKARFAKGVFAPKGLLYYPRQVPENYNLQHSLPRALRKSAFQMCKLPLPFIGTRGIHSLAGQLEKLDHKADPRYARLFLGNIVRMQEEIGTGGAGFRFMYASFLQQAAEELGDTALQAISEEMTEVGDHWRGFALSSAGYIRDRQQGGLKAIAAQLEAIATQERAVFEQLWRYAK